MNRIEAARILHPDTTSAALAPYAYDKKLKLDKVQEACLVAAACLTNPAYNDERRASVAKALRRLVVETGSLACMGCGYEHNCSAHGCAVIKAAIDLLDPPDKPSYVSNLDTSGRSASGAVDDWMRSRLEEMAQQTPKMCT